MAKIKTIFLEDESGANTTIEIGYHTKAKQKDVNFVLAQPINLDGRSEWRWIRLQNGTLILGCFPCGDTYIEISDNLKI